MPEVRQAAMILVHYEHHVTMHGQSDLGFWEYLVNHFAGRTHQDMQHHDLPFHNTSTSNSSFVYIQVHIPAAIVPPLMQRCMPHHNDVGVPIHREEYIFQPPRS